MCKLQVEGNEVEGELLGKRQDGNYPTPPEGKILGKDDSGRPCYIPGGSPRFLVNRTIKKVLHTLHLPQQ